MKFGDAIGAQMRGTLALDRGWELMQLVSEGATTRALGLPAWTLVAFQSGLLLWGQSGCHG
jgi:hypothetical protein